MPGCERCAEVAGLLLGGRLPECMLSLGGRRRLDFRRIVS